MNSTGDKTLVTNMGQANLPLEISRRLAWAAMVAIFVVGIVLSLKQILAFKIASEDASSYYLSLGRAIFNGDWGHGQLPMIPPLYPLVLGVLAKCFFWAEQPLIVAGQVLNLVCFLASMVGVFWIGKILFSCRVGIAATAFVAVNQWLLKYTASIGPEMLYTFLLTMIAMLLAMYYCRPTAAKAGLIGAAAAMAMLTRSEGMVIFGCAFVVVVMIGVFVLKGKLIRGMLYVLVMLVVGAAILVPRIISVHSMIGSYVHDLRMVPYLNEGYTLLDLRDYPPPGHEGRHVDPYDIGFASLPATAIPPAPPPGLSTKSLGPDISEGFLMLFGLPSIFLAAVWFIIRSPIPRNWSGQLVVGAILITQIVAVVAMMVASQGVAEFSRRYTLPVVPIFQLWAGLGMVAICERFRMAKNPLFAAFGGAIKPQLIFLGAMMAGSSSIDCCFLHLN